MSDLLILVTAIATFAVVGVGIGMLVARRLDQWAAHVDEEPVGDDRPDA